jgi:hypothetical protein
MKRIVLGALLAAAALALAGAAGGGGAVVASAQGNASFTLHDVFGLQTLELKKFSFEARRKADGHVIGRYDYRDVEDGAPFDASGPITCLTVQGNHAWLGGLVASSNDPTVAGDEMWFQVIDNGAPRNPPLDVTTLIGVSPVAGSAQAYCDAAAPPRFPWPDTDGHITVRSS